MSVDADDDGVNVPEISTVQSAIGELWMGPSGFEAVACMKGSGLELGRAHGSLQGYGHPTNGRMRK